MVVPQHKNEHSQQRHNAHNDISSTCRPSTPTVTEPAALRHLQILSAASPHPPPASAARRVTANSAVNCARPALPCPAPLRCPAGRSTLNGGGVSKEE
ncbi:hypothetical protein E2C01_081527 [Portunus trituberculatus]|uniref:Uncharacterized protein n=1 Tax=Portunus trituberculatus TaxID=210409 RepID=A0A5B7IMH7_PORTR|nr:hypothetical protein [Portunus trituberculatus]